MSRRWSSSTPSSLARTVFLVVYHALYSIIYVVLLGLVLLTPADFIVQAHSSGRLFIIWIVAVCVLVTALIQSFIYALRLYTNQSILASIPKTSIPLSRKDVPLRVIDLVSAGLDHSAAVALLARPSVPPSAPPHLTDAANTVEGVDQRDRSETTTHKQGRVDRLSSRASNAGYGDVSVVQPPPQPVWGVIEHSGWSSPTSTDIAPSLQFEVVISELPNLAEAKALTPGPRDRAAAVVTNSVAVLDPAAVVALQRSHSMTLRDYLEHLAELGVCPASHTTAAFLSAYEAARFSTRPLSSAQFRDLLGLFSRVIDAMQPLDPSILIRRDPSVEDSWSGTHDRGNDDDNDNIDNIDDEEDENDEDDDSGGGGGRGTPPAGGWAPDLSPSRTYTEEGTAGSSAPLGFARTRRPYENSVASGSDVSGSVIHSTNPANPSFEVPRH